MAGKDRPAREYPAQGDPWADFLHHRARVIDMFMAEGKTPSEIAHTLSMDPVQVRLIHQRQAGSEEVR